MDPSFMNTDLHNTDDLMYNPESGFNDDFLASQDGGERLDQFNDNQAQDNGGYIDSQGSQQRQRISGELLALLVSEFAKNPTPNGPERKRISEQANISEKRIRVWFQNRRAKSKKMMREQTNDKDENRDIHAQEIATSRYDKLPLNINRNYHFIDANSLKVGTWHRLKSGNLSGNNIMNVKSLSNLSPSSINAIMDNSTDLMVVISKKNNEINYFFSAITQQSKLLFRVFYPISGVEKGTLSITSEDERTCELKLYLKHPPQFAVAYTNQIEQSRNQWSICEDFSEGHQVNEAYIGGSGVAHIIHGLQESLGFLNSFILEYNSSNIDDHSFALPPRFKSRSPTYFPPNTVNHSQQHQQQYQQQQNIHQQQQPQQYQQQQQHSSPEYPQSIETLDTLPAFNGEQQISNPQIDPNHFQQHNQQSHLLQQHQYQQQRQDQEYQASPNQLQPGLDIQPGEEFDNNILNEFVQSDLAITPGPNDSFDMFLQQATGDSNLIISLDQADENMHD